MLRNKDDAPHVRTMGYKIIVSREGVAAFNRAWPCSKLRDSRCYWFEFDDDRDLVDTDCPQQDDGPEASAMADDCRTYLFDDIAADWMEQ